MKKIALILAVIVVSCNQKNMIITSNHIGEFVLGKKITKEFNTKSFDITLDNDKNIRSIISRSKQYKTINGFGIGTNLESIEKLSNYKRKELNISKGTVSIGSIGKVVVYNDILFVDENNDNLVDFVWIQRK